jgi:hypothetical protein
MKGLQLEGVDGGGESTVRSTVNIQHPTFNIQHSRGRMRLRRCGKEVAEMAKPKVVMEIWNLGREIRAENGG